MHQIPKEFDPEFIKAKSSSDMQMYRAERTSREPMKSVLENNPEIYIVPPQRSSTWGNWEFHLTPFIIRLELAKWVQMK